MHQVQINFPSRFVRNLSRQVPGQWNELSRGQLLKVTAILYQGTSDSCLHREWMQV